MNDMNDCCVAENREPSWRTKLRGAKHTVQHWLFLNIWCRYFYRHVMRTLHRFNLHYAPPNEFEPKYGEHNHWCQWCGLRGKTFTFDPNEPLRAQINDVLPEL